jgi:DHA1 family multidrug resistance protein-like MFS transporter
VIETEVAADAPARWRLGRASWILLVGNALQSTGVGFFFPILPIYAQSRGASSLEIGAMLTAGVAGAALAQFPGGWLADRFDRRSLVVFFQVVYGLCFPLYLLPVAPAWLILLRFLHTTISSGYQPTAMALLADMTPAERRGRMFGFWNSSFMFGLLVGPAAGGALGLIGLQFAFWGAAIACLSSAATLTLLPRPAQVTAPKHGAGASAWSLVKVLLPAMLAGGGTSFGIGCYDAVWSLYVHANGGGPFVIGLSFTLFALPVLLFSGFAGSLSDRLGPKPVVAWSTLIMGSFASAYGFIHSIPALLGLGVVEGSTVVGGRPALQALVSRSVPETHQGRAQGAFQTSSFVLQGVGSLVGGALFGLNHAYSFLSIGAACWLAAAAVPFLGRRRI